MQNGDTKTHQAKKSYLKLLAENMKCLTLWWENQLVQNIHELDVTSDLNKIRKATEHQIIAECFSEQEKGPSVSERLPVMEQMGKPILQHLHLNI